MGVKFKGAAVWKTFKEEDNGNRVNILPPPKTQLDSGMTTQYLKKQVYLAIITE